MPITHNIFKEISSELSKAKFEIYVAVAWFTDKRLFDLLYEKGQKGVKVKILMLKDKINSQAGFDHRDIENVKGDCYFRDHHHKFCVIDRKIVITGSSNWTRTAVNSFNRESIEIFDNKSQGEEYAELFLKVLEKTIYYQDYDFSDDYKLRFFGSFQRVVNWAEKDGLKFRKPIGEKIEDLWKKRSSFPVLISGSNDDKTEIRIMISEELRKVIEEERKNIIFLPVYQIIHRSGSTWNGALVLGLEENNEQRFDLGWVM
jgi:phosphatidylserine/phosphatidylglycerophosphate/cardiolipin synthase-like enzyme